MTTSLRQDFCYAFFLAFLLPLLGKIKDVCKDANAFETALNTILPAIIADENSPLSGALRRLLAIMSSKTPFSYVVSDVNSETLGRIFARLAGKGFILFKNGAFYDVAGHPVAQLNPSSRICIFVTCLTDGIKAIAIADAVAALTEPIDTLFSVINYEDHAAELRMGMEIYSITTLTDILDFALVNQSITESEKMEVEKSRKSEVPAL